MNSSIDFRDVKCSSGNLVVGKSIPMSCLCYTIFRLDPYIGCRHDCVYCYTKFFPSLRPSVIGVRRDLPKVFSRIVLELSRRGIPVPVFRLSELTDGFQPIERKLRLSYQLMQTCLRYEVPLIISTKSDMIAESPWIDVIKELVDRKLAYVQYTLTLLDDEDAKILEPFAPLPSRRMRAMEILRDEGVPLVLRFQPIIPYVSTDIDYIEEYVETAESLGVRHIIGEFLRIHSWRVLNELKRLHRKDRDFYKLFNRGFWINYPLASCKHPPRAFRKRVYENINYICSRHGIKFSTCRETFFNYILDKDCCGVYLLRKRILRFTLYEHMYGVREDYKYITDSHVARMPHSAFKSKIMDHITILLKTIDNKKLMKLLLNN